MFSWCLGCSSYLRNSNQGLGRALTEVKVRWSSYDSEMVRFYSISESTQYSQLLPMGENSDDDEWDDDKMHKNANSDDENDARGPEVVIRDTDKLLRGNPLRNNGTAYNFSRKRKEKDNSFCTPTRAAILFATVLLCLGAGYLAGFITQGFRTKITAETSHHVIHKRTDNWRTKMPDWGRFTMLFQMYYGKNLS